MLREVSLITHSSPHFETPPVSQAAACYIENLLTSPVTFQASLIYSNAAAQSFWLLFLKQPSRFLRQPTNHAPHTFGILEPLHTGLPLTLFFPLDGFDTRSSTADSVSTGSIVVQPVSIMATVSHSPAARQPFAPLDGARLQTLTSMKNRQNGMRDS